MPENEPTRRPPTIDAVAAERWARTPTGGTSPWLHEEVGRRMEDRLQWIKAQPRTWADWAPLRGGLEAHGLVARRYPQAAGHVVEPEAGLQQATAQALAQPWWSARRWNAARTRFGAESVPEEGVDLLWANMALHNAGDPEALIGRWHRLVATNGFLMFSCLGPDTLAELRALYTGHGWAPAGHDFTDMHDWGDMLVHAGFAEPVMDMEHVQLTWSSPDALLSELRTLGRNLHPGRFGGLRGRRWRADLQQALAEKMNTEGRISMTFEIIYGHAFKPQPRVALSPESAVSLRDMRSMLQGRRGPTP
ncbi:biotin synthase [Variovorax sp. OV329]|uniref:biotin synthase n=1 Tax=Variovorax sp. OV329 TaxID=1882825 RepID=UPI0008E37539|nr:biotin synthase [Variovorax sp. OV329]SFM76276.1 malonyl-CoA O-methyltransferase [Variovorax sp. OV329]